MEQKKVVPNPLCHKSRFLKFGNLSPNVKNSINSIELYINGFLEVKFILYTVTISCKSRKWYGSQRFRTSAFNNQINGPSSKT